MFDLIYFYLAFTLGVFIGAGFIILLNRAADKQQYAEQRFYERTLGFDASVMLSPDCLCKKHTLPSHQTYLDFWQGGKKA